MNTVTFSNGTAAVKQTTKYARIFIDAALATALEYPFADPESIEGIERAEVFNEDGKRYKNLEAFMEAYELSDHEVAAGTEQPEALPLMEESQIDWEKVFVFESIEQLRRTWRMASAVAQTELKLFVTGTIAVGKQRLGKSKQWLEEPMSISGLQVERAATKWIFFVGSEPELFAKSLENATFTFTK